MANHGQDHGQNRAPDPAVVGALRATRSPSSASPSIPQAGPEGDGVRAPLLKAQRDVTELTWQDVDEGLVAAVLSDDVGLVVGA
jgi:hypothetical protein